MNTTAALSLREILAHFLLMSRGSYPTPEDAADALMLRLRNEGYEIVRWHEVQAAGEQAE